VIACDPYVDNARFAALGVERVSLEALAERADYVSVHTLLNAETRHLIGEAFFHRTKGTALLINTSRGPVVDEQALARALQEGRLAGAALDVWEQEPVAPDHPLLKLGSVIATPHAAYFSSPAVAQVPRRCGEEVARVLPASDWFGIGSTPGAALRARWTQPRAAPPRGWTGRAGAARGQPTMDRLRPSANGGSTSRGSRSSSAGPGSQAKNRGGNCTGATARRHGCGRSSGEGLQRRAGPPRVAGQLA
jgi:hypothetical protein